MKKIKFFKEQTLVQISLRFWAVAPHDISSGQLHPPDFFFFFINFPQNNNNLINKLKPLVKEEVIICLNYILNAFFE